jgi:hypothetical protein
MCYYGRSLQLSGCLAHTCLADMPRSHTSLTCLAHTPCSHTSLTCLAHTPRSHTSLTCLAHTPRSHLPRSHLPRSHLPRSHTSLTHLAPTCLAHTPRSHASLTHLQQCGQRRLKLRRLWAGGVGDQRRPRRAAGQRKHAVVGARVAVHLRVDGGNHSVAGGGARLVSACMAQPLKVQGQCASRMVCLKVQQALLA